MNPLAIQQEFDQQLASSRKSTESLTRQLNVKKDAEAAQDASDIRTASMVLSAMSKIRVPDDGKNGTDGHDGLDGIPGIDGIRGIQGVTGKTGATGKQGLQGKPGKDAKNGTDGTVGIKGLDGATGEAGEDGLDGRDGTNGTNGIDGKAGPTGDRGEAGSDGKDGSNGLDGDSIEGTPGKDGVDGLQGKSGVDGNDGLQGSTGEIGKQGARGKKGDSGTDGVGIKNIHTEGTYLKIALTDGKTKTLTMPVRGGAAPIAIPPIQRALRTPTTATGIIATNVEAALEELNTKIVESSAGNPFPVGTSEHFMFNFNPYDETHDGSFGYNGSQLITKTLETSEDVELYSLTFGYTGTQLTSKIITDSILNDLVTVTFIYDNENRLIKKSHEYTQG